MVPRMAATLMKESRGRTVKAFTLTAVGLGSFIIAGCGTSRPQSDHHHLHKASQAVAQALAWVHKQPQLHVSLEGPRWLPRTTNPLSESATTNPAIQQYTVGIWTTKKSLGVNNPELHREPKTWVAGWAIERWPGATSIKGLEVMDAGFVLPMGAHSPVPLGRMTGQAYSGGLQGQDHIQIPLVAWTEHGWTWEVIAPSKAAAEHEASQIAAKLRNTSLPASEGVGFVNLVHGPSLSLTWVHTHTLVFLQSGSPSTLTLSNTLKMASSWARWK